MQLTVALNNSALEALWRPWHALWQLVPEVSPFLSPAWLKPWWDTFGTGYPVVAVLSARDHLLGLLPLYRLHDKLLPIGVGVSDHTGILLHPDTPQDAARALLDSALAAGGTARCDLPDLPPGSPLLSVPPPSGWTASLWDGPPCPVLPLKPAPAIPKSMRRDIRQARHRGERAGGWTVETATEANFGRLFDRLAELHGARWRGRGESGVLNDPQVLAFHRGAGPLLIRHGLLRLQSLMLRGQPAAAIYALLSPGRISFYLSGFDPACTFESPGMLLLSHMIDEAVREGRREVDFLRGDERYKYAWGGIDRLNTGLGLNRR